MQTDPPLVTVILPTYNRAATVGSAVNSVVRQSFSDWELLVVNDGGRDVKEIVDGFRDNRIVYLSNLVNQGKAVCCNMGLEKARGRLIAYLDDDDIWYPNHLEALTRVFRENPDVEAAYSDLYRVGFVLDKKTNQRYPIDKKIIVSRDFNRDFMFHHNHVLHVSLMHTSRAGVRVGGYNSSITAMIDWNIARKLAFCYDIYHLPVVTGEYYAPFEVTDRISHVQITDKRKFDHIVRKVKADMPAPPWPHVASVEVILTVDRWDSEIGNTVTGILDEVSYPVTFLLIDNGTGQGDEGLSCLGEIGELKNIRILTLPDRKSVPDAFRIGARHSSADYIVPAGPNMNVRLLKTLFYQMLEAVRSGRCDMVPLNRSVNGNIFEAFVRRDSLLRDDFPRKSGFILPGDLETDEIPTDLKPDLYISQAAEFTSKGRYEEAVRMIHQAVSFDRGAPKLQSQMDRLFNLYLKLERYQTAEFELRKLIDQGYRADNCVRLGRILEIQSRYEEAIEAYQNGLEALGLKPVHLNSTVFPQRLPEECDAFTALMGMGECFHKTGRLAAAEHMFWLARKVNLASPRPYLGYAAVLADSNRLEEARTILTEADALKDACFPEKHFILGKIHHQTGDHTSALAEFLQAYQNGRRDWEVLDYLLQIGENRNAWPSLFDVFTTFVAQNPADPKAAQKLEYIKSRLSEKRPLESDNKRHSPDNAPTDLPHMPTPSTKAPNSAKIGRNDPCPCGSGRKYKKCCLA